MVAHRIILTAYTSPTPSWQGWQATPRAPPGAQTSTSAGPAKRFKQLKNPGHCATAAPQTAINTYSRQAKNAYRTRALLALT